MRILLFNYDERRVLILIFEVSESNKPEKYLLSYSFQYHNVTLMGTRPPHLRDKSLLEYERSHEKEIGLPGILSKI